MSITLKERLLSFLSQGLKFGAVGALGFVVDFTVFNLLRTTVLDSADVHAGPLYAKVISTILAIAVNWIGNRYWTFSKNQQSQTLREGIEFLAVSLVGMGIGIGCLWFSPYVLGNTSVLADNNSGNVVGLVLGAVFRFTLYRYWVFAPSRSGAARVDAGADGSAAGSAAGSLAGSLASAGAGSLDGAAVGFGAGSLAGAAAESAAGSAAGSAANSGADSAAHAGNAAAGSPAGTGTRRTPAAASAGVGVAGALPTRGIALAAAPES